jgi:hypothetical protein
VPRGYNQVTVGDVWVAFAYITSDAREQPLSQITGFYECVRAREYGKIPPFFDKARPPYEDPYGTGKAWLIEGKEYGSQPDQPVVVPPIDKLLHRRTFGRTTLTRISAGEFEHVQKETFARQESLGRVPLLGRSPKCEQELLCAVVFGHKQLGIERIVSVQKGFPDLCVDIEGGPRQVHLEIEVYASGFQSHGHAARVRDGKFDGDGADVGVLCWVDDDEDHWVSKCVHGRVYELGSLLKEDTKIIW